MFTREKLEEEMKIASISQYREAGKHEAMWMPMYFVDKNTQEFKRVVGMSSKIQNIETTDSYVVTVGYDGKEWYVAVGNDFLTGTISQDTADLITAELCNEVIESSQMQSLFSTFAEETASNHWREWSTKGELSDEAQHFLCNVLTPVDLDEIENHFYGQTKKEENEEAMIAARMRLYAFKRHLLFIGEKGSGKTHDIYAFMKKEALPHVFVGGNADVEAMDLKGNLLPYEKDGEKNFIWVDGPLTQAFRRAASGEKVVLFIDELLRMSKSAQSLLVPALTTDNDGNYVLDTGRVIDVVEGVGKTECIKAPSANLWVLGTTNMGAEYGTPDMESALEDRFELIEKNNDMEKIRRVLTEIALEKSFDVSVVENLVDFYTSMVSLKEEGVLAKLINLRHLAQSMQDSKTRNDLYDCLMDRVPKWVERDMGGKLLDDQIEVIKKALRKADIR